MAGSASLDPDRKKLTRILILASQDMHEASAAAHALRELRKAPGNDEPHALVMARALETTIVVSYGRSFKRDNKKQCLRDDDVPPDKRRLHRKLMRLRDKVYAHSDTTPLERQVKVTRTSTSTAFSVHTVDLSSEMIDEIIDLCEFQAGAFSAMAYMRGLLNVESASV